MFWIFPAVGLLLAVTHGNYEPHTPMALCGDTHNTVERSDDGIYKRLIEFLFSNHMIRLIIEKHEVLELTLYYYFVTPKI